MGRGVTQEHHIAIHSIDVGGQGGIVQIAVKMKLMGLMVSAMIVGSCIPMMV